MLIIFFWSAPVGKVTINPKLPKKCQTDNLEGPGFIDFFLYRKPQDHSIILAGRFQTPAQSKVSSKVRHGVSGLYLIKSFPQICRLASLLPACTSERWSSFVSVGLHVVEFHENTANPFRSIQTWGFSILDDSSLGWMRSGPAEYSCAACWGSRVTQETSFHEETLAELSCGLRETRWSLAKSKKVAPER